MPLHNPYPLLGHRPPRLLRPHRHSPHRHRSRRADPWRRRQQEHPLPILLGLLLGMLLPLLGLLRSPHSLLLGLLLGLCSLLLLMGWGQRSRSVPTATRR